MEAETERKDKIINDYNVFQQSGEDWSDGDGSVVRGESGEGVWCIGRFEAVFHCLGTVDKDSDRFIMSLIGAEQNGAPVRRNQAGMLSNSS